MESAYKHGTCPPVFILDSTLRDGSQGEGISFTVHDKLAIVKKLDKLGISYIEAGNPASNPKDMEFFTLALSLPLAHATLVAFGSTRRKNSTAAEDKNLAALLNTGVKAVTIVGKSSEEQVLEVLHTTLSENLAMISDTITYLKQHEKQVIFDAEHFFDGYVQNPEYALATLDAAKGADVITLCDTNGANFPCDIERITKEVCGFVSCSVGIHCHNDIGMAVANSLAAVNAGATHVQGTYIGFGERCGNANLSTIIANLQLKLGYSCIPSECIVRLTKTALFIAETANLTPDSLMPYVGKSAFAHKGGMHVDGVFKRSASFEHITPETIGNSRSILLSEMAGRTAMLSIINEVDPTITRDSQKAEELVGLLKELESRGYLFETATASLELAVAKHLGKFKPLFELVFFKVIGEQTKDAPSQLSTALIKIRVGNKTEITAAEGDGPVNALDNALKKAVVSFYPAVKNVRLIDYKVRVIEPSDATAALVRVIITSTDGERIWTTVGVSRDIIDASLQALLDSLEYI